MFKTSIRNRLIAILLIITTIPFGTSIIITYFYTKDSIKNQYIEENVNLLYQGRVNIESYINDFKDLTVSFYNNTDFMRYMRSKGETADYVMLSTLKDVMTSILYADSSINRVVISFPENEMGLQKYISVSKQSTLSFTTVSNNPNKKYFQKAEANEYYMYMEPADQGRDVITLHRVLMDAPSVDVLGFISIDIYPEKIAEISNNLYDKRAEDFYILSEEGDVIFSSQANSAANADFDWFDSIVTSGNERGMQEWSDPTFTGMIVYDKLPESSGGWLLVKKIPYTTLFKDAISVAKLNIVFGVIGLTLVILATLFVSFKITSPIRILLTNIKQVERGNMEVQFESLGQDEIGILGERFRKMMKRINELINLEYKLKLENKTNQLKVLQSQLNPHFLNNALQSIGTLALKNNVPQIYTLVNHLSKIMRYGMNIEEDMVPLKKEKDYIQAYVLLQKERFGDDLSFSIDFEPEMLDKLIPKMLLQPIVENYFKHGFDIRDGQGEIDVKGSMETDHLVITVRDTGTGVSEQRLKEITHYIYQAESQGGKEASLGLKNIHDRLHLYYGEKASMTFANHREGGFVVTLILPFEQVGEINESNHRG
ncbi:sensor histidine kinase [Aquibacillus salsiterrae]|uniref:histidine kinase n=1 Tax=Aquibacillus salsiterrae TaxID=2950439 RepID=A0A9X3WAQ2_9BACI|nr:sensor histidine kinase [Aquibacillus salsiterrae]MDC3415820.1 sensor histidine kinase [Aquibacillus salsiterrae]